MYMYMYSLYFNYSILPRGTATTSEVLVQYTYMSHAVMPFSIQLIFLQQYFPIPVPCNITRYCTARVLLHGCYCTGPGATRYPSNYDVL